MKTPFLFVALVAICLSPLQAEVRMNALFGDHMVLQRDMEVPIWGMAGPGEGITVSFAGQSVATKADAEGKWMVRLKPLAASSQPRELRVRGSNELVFSDVLVGEVWLCSGQSNMGLSVARSDHTPEDLTVDDSPPIRLMKVTKNPSRTPAFDLLKSKWTLATPEFVNSFSAVAYFFARQIGEKQNVPIGLIAPFYGATPAEAWVSLEGLGKSPSLSPYVAEFEAATSRKPAPSAVESDNDSPSADAGPGKKGGAKKDSQIATYLYNGMIHPVQPFGIRGVIWYQGENNAKEREDAERYAVLFPALIADWREKWGQGNFPFLFVQLAGWRPGENWPWLRDAQLKSLSVPATAMAVTLDIGEAKDIHPKNKKDVARRLALAARHVAYGEDIVHSGPIFESMTLSGNSARLKFAHAGGGLCAGKDASALPLTGFEIAGADNNFVKADAAIDGNAVVVSNDSVPVPKAVRYGWSGFPDANLYNKEGLPASPFSAVER